MRGRRADDTLQDSADRLTAVMMMNARVLDRRRQTGTKDVAIGTQQMEVALKALWPGGGLFAIAGRGMAMNGPTPD